MKSRWISKINNKFMKLWLSDETIGNTEPMAAIFLQATHVKDRQSHEAKNDEVMIGILDLKKATILRDALSRFLDRYEKSIWISFPQ